MPVLALMALAAAAVPTGEVRAFWKTDLASGGHPPQARIEAELAASGEHLVVYRERGYQAPGLADEAALAELVRTFDEVIYPRQEAAFGPVPDRDGNGRVIILVTPLASPSAQFFRIDELDQADAERRGFHSNQGEVIYHPFAYSGDRSRANLAGLDAAFHRLLHWARDPSETAWADMIGSYLAFEHGLASARSLWGDTDPSREPPAPDDPYGWQLLFARYLRELLGEHGLGELVARPETGFDGLAATLAARKLPGPWDTLADFAAACWFDDPALANGAFAFRGVTPPRPAPLARLAASRPVSGQTQVGVGGAAYLVVYGDGERPQALTVRGDARVRWHGRAVLLRRLGPDEVLALGFDDAGRARLEIPALARGDAVVVAVVPEPADGTGLDRRLVALRWGVGWVPEAPVDRSREELAELARQGLPDGGSAARSRLLATIDRLSGGEVAPDNGPRLVTRYAWAPEANDVVAAIRDEAHRRGLEVRVQPFVRTAPGGIHQNWLNLLIDLPGTDSRRWPLVLAAHWDGSRSRLDDAYLRALNLNDNASGVAVALEAASALARTPHRAPILVALLDGGYHRAAGAQALVEQLGGKISGWVELDGVGVPEPWPRHLTVNLEGVERLELFAIPISQSLRRAGLTVRSSSRPGSDHTVLALPVSAGFPSLVMRTRTPVDPLVELDLPPAAEQAMDSGDLMVLLARSLASGLAAAAGTP